MHHTSTAIQSPTSDRSQCPADERVRALANGKIPDDPALAKHVEECEWCAREYRDHARDLEFNRFISRSTKLMYVVILVIIVIEIVRHIYK